MDSLTRFQNPLKSDSISLTNPKQLLGVVGFVALMGILVGLGMYVKNLVVSKLPASAQGAVSGSGGGMTWAQ